MASAQGWSVTGLVRSQISAQGLRSQGIAALVSDLDLPLAKLPPAELLFYFAPPPADGDDDPRLAAVLAQFAPRSLRRLVYISSSGVYGDCAGAWVDETRPVAPATGRARRRVAAEGRLRAWGGPAVILRAPGIYGPGRLAIARLQNAVPVLCDADSPWTNRIHVHDLAASAMAAAERGPAPAVYNASDGQPTRQGAWYRAVAQVLGLAPPPEVTWAQAQHGFDALRLSFLNESRRLDNRRLRNDLGVSLRFADQRAGLEACLAQDHCGSTSAGAGVPR